MLFSLTDFNVTITDEIDPELMLKQELEYFQSAPVSPKDWTNDKKIPLASNFLKSK